MVAVFMDFHVLAFCPQEKLIDKSKVRCVRIVGIQYFPYVCKGFYVEPLFLLCPCNLVICPFWGLSPVA